MTTNFRYKSTASTLQSKNWTISPPKSKTRKINCPKTYPNSRWPSKYLKVKNKHSKNKSKTFKSPQKNYRNNISNKSSNCWDKSQNSRNSSRRRKRKSSPKTILSWKKRSPKSNPMTSLTSTRNYTKMLCSRYNNSSQWTWKILSNSRPISTTYNKLQSSTTAMMKRIKEGRRLLKTKAITIQARTPVHLSGQSSKPRWPFRIIRKRNRSCKRT